MNGVVREISSPEDATIGSTVCPSRSVNHVPREVSVAVYVKVEESKMLE